MRFIGAFASSHVRLGGRIGIRFQQNQKVQAVKDHPSTLGFHLNRGALVATPSDFVLVKNESEGCIARTLGNPERIESRGVICL